jgi:hypothetical protein
MHEAQARRALTEDERSLIVDLLEEEIPGLQEEIRHTDDQHYRDDLKERKKTRLALLAKLRHAPALQEGKSTPQSSTKEEWS